MFDGLVRHCHRLVVRVEGRRLVCGLRSRCPLGWRCTRVGVRVIAIEVLLCLRFADEWEWLWIWILPIVGLVWVSLDTDCWLRLLATLLLTDFGFTARDVCRDVWRDWLRSGRQIVVWVVYDVRTDHWRYERIDLWSCEARDRCLSGGGSGTWLTDAVVRVV